MNYGFNPSLTNDLAALTHKAGAKISSAIEQASAKTGVAFSYLLQQANVESSFKTDAKAKTSSATGLYQFTDSTWLETVRDHGAKYGLGNLANQISDDGHVSSRAVKNQILSLRKDPQIASAMAAEYAADNKQYLQSTVGGDIGSTELYLAHFMGPAGAAKFLSKMQDNPDAVAAKSFTQQACSNKSIFYSETGKPRTLSEIYAFFDNKFQGGDTSAPTQVANADTSLDAQTLAVLRSPTFTAAENSRANIFDENTGEWFSTSNPKDVSFVNSMMPTNKGMIAGLSHMLSNPLDVMQLAQMANLHNDSSRYNS